MIAIPEKTNYKFYKTYTNQLTHKQNVIFALYCAEISFHFLKDNLELEEKAKICIDLVKQWLEDSESVTKTQLINAAVAVDAARDAARDAWAASAAARDAWAAADSVSAAAWVASSASWVASSASWAATDAASVSAAWAAATATWAAADASSAAASNAAWASASAYAAASAVAAKIKIIPYLSCLISVKLPNINYDDPIEQLVYYTDQLNLQLLILSINGFRLNLWDKSYEYQIEGSMEEIVMVTGIKYLLKGIIENTKQPLRKLLKRL